MLNIRTLFQRRLFVLLQPLDRDRLEPDSGGRVVLEHVPHVLLAQHEQVGVAHGADGRGAAVAWK